MNSTKFIDQLIVNVKEQINKAKMLKELDDEVLFFKSSSKHWNSLECLEHLNLYGEYYHPKLREAIENSTVKPSLFFKRGLIGGYFSRSMLPKTKLNKMTTFKDKNPINQSLDRKVIDTFINQSQELLNLLEKSKHSNLIKVKVGISITKLIKLRLGDLFEFIINHNTRHLNQVDRCIKAGKVM